MKHGDIVSIALQGDFGKPRPALVIQADLFNETHPTITVLPITTEIISAPLFRITIEPTPNNGLHNISQIMVDKIVTVKKEKIGSVFGCLDDEIMIRVSRSLAVWLNIV